MGFGLRRRLGLGANLVPCLKSWALLHRRMNQVFWGRGQDARSLWLTVYLPFGGPVQFISEISRAEGGSPAP
ncbi:MAG: hypothetical protein AAF773_03490 [Cyanobacteria bacterium P01_D01_bin.115]